MLFVPASSVNPLADGLEIMRFFDSDGKQVKMMFTQAMAEAAILNALSSLASSAYGRHIAVLPDNIAIYPSNSSKQIIAAPSLLKEK